METLQRPQRFHPRFHRHNNGLYIPSLNTWTPLNIAGLVEWWNPRDTAKITGGANVSQFTGSFAGLNMIRIGAAGPSSGTRTANGKNVLDWVPATVGALKCAAAVITPQPFTISIVAANDAAASAITSFCWYGLAPAAGADCAMALDGADTKVEVYAGAWSNSSTKDTSLHLWIAVMNGASSVLYKDGTAQATTNPGTNALPNGIALGGAYNNTSDMDGATGDFIMSTGSMDASTRANLRTYSQTQYATP